MNPLDIIPAPRLLGTSYLAGIDTATNGKPPSPHKLTDKLVACGADPDDIRLDHVRLAYLNGYTHGESIARPGGVSLAAQTLQLGIDTRLDAYEQVAASAAVGLEDELADLQQGEHWDS